jgi:hypothetical protein
MILGVNVVILLIVNVARILGTKNLAANADFIVVYAGDLCVTKASIVIICHRMDCYLIIVEK